MAKDAVVSEELAKKFATEKETPYTRWVKSEGLDIISALYVRNLRTVELKPWARRGGNAVFVNHDASRVSNDCYVLRDPAGQEARAAAPAVRGDDPRPRRPRLHHGVEQRGQAHHLRVEGGLAVRHPAQRLAPALQRLRQGAGALRRRHQRPPVINLYEDLDFIFGCEHDFKNRFNGEPDYFSAKGEQKGCCCRPTSSPTPSTCR